MCELYEKPAAQGVITGEENKTMKHIGYQNTMTTILEVKPTEEENVAKFLGTTPDFVKQMSGLDFLISVLKKIDKTNGWRKTK